jgi:hypothetical protein
MALCLAMPMTVPMHFHDVTESQTLGSEDTEWASMSVTDFKNR